jgi:hypothetical protein
MQDLIKAQLREGELYAGVILGKDGAPDQHIALLPGETRGTWEQANEWAASVGGELPTRREQSLLFANLQEEFEDAWYWSGEQYGSHNAWLQYFVNGSQDYYDFRDYSGRARAVRRFFL